jgi:hypothetical protein
LIADWRQDCCSFVSFPWRVSLRWIDSRDDPHSEAVKKLGQAPSRPLIFWGFSLFGSEPVPFFHSLSASRQMVAVVQIQHRHGTSPTIGHPDNQQPPRQNGRPSDRGADGKWALRPRSADRSPASGSMSGAQGLTADLVSAEACLAATPGSIRNLLSAAAPPLEAAVRRRRGGEGL